MKTGISFNSNYGTQMTDTCTLAAMWVTSRMGRKRDVYMWNVFGNKKRRTHSVTQIELTQYVFSNL